MKSINNLGMLYHIQGLCPRTDISLGRCGFNIQLFPDWKKLVEKSQLTQEAINTIINKYHRIWLDGCGFGNLYDPDKGPLEEWEELETGKTPKYGPNTRPLYGPHDIRVSWGEWGLEHITIPGNACGLDIDNGLFAPPDGRILVPHNIDNFSQAMLLLTIFTTFADFLIY